MLVLWRKILAFFFPHKTLTGQEWYQHLASYFHPPKAHMTWIEKKHKLEMNWQQAKLSLLETPEDVDMPFSGSGCSPNY